MQKGVAFTWGDRQQKSYEELKFAILEGTACAYLDFAKDFILKTDGSDTTVGAVLSQNDKRGHEQIVACASQKLNDGERRWCVFDKEMYTLLYGICSFTH